MIQTKVIHATPEDNLEGLLNKTFHSLHLKPAQFITVEYTTWKTSCLVQSVIIFYDDDDPQES